MGKIKFIHTYQYITSVENLLEAWKEFSRGKRSRQDVQQFELDLMGNILLLHCDLASGNYCHGGYHAFNISDPKPRNIHKASVRDRLVHHAVYRILYPFFDRVFIADSYSCRKRKGAHKALNRFKRFAYKVSKSNTKICWVLKGDVKKFFASIDHQILKDILTEYILDKKVLDLLRIIIGSFKSGTLNIGLPLGNLTSQLLVNIYMNEFDQFVKHRMKIKYYIRYADDFVIFSGDKMRLKNLIALLADFLSIKLKLTMHPDKIFIKTLASGVDFLGWIHFSDYQVLRTATARRMLRRVEMKKKDNKTIQSYFGLLKHGNAMKLSREIIRRLADKIEYYLLVKSDKVGYN